MLTRNYHLDRLLLSLWNTESFLIFCRVRGVPVEPGTPGEPAVDAIQRWKAAVAQLPGEGQARIEAELAKVQELSGRDFIAHLR